MPLARAAAAPIPAPPRSLPRKRGGSPEAPWVVISIAFCVTVFCFGVELRHAMGLQRALQRERTASLSAQWRLAQDAQSADERTATLASQLQEMDEETEHLYGVVRAMQGLGEQLRERVGLPGPAMEPVPDLPPRAGRLAEAGATPPGQAQQNVALEYDAGATTSTTSTASPASLDGNVPPAMLSAGQLALLPKDTGPWPTSYAGPPVPVPPSARLSMASEVIARQWDSWQQLSQTIDSVLNQRSKAVRPSIHPAYGPITSPFGRRADFFGALAYHTGIDISVPIGTAVAATADGTVIFAGSLPDYGQTVQIQHASGLLTLYGHLSRPLVRAGQVVTQSQVIALSGNTGISTGPHLHYEIRLNDVPVDPSRYW